MISGTQGEPMSALSRAAVDNHKHARIERGDTVVLSSRVIPGNEKSIYRVIDHLCRREANVIYDDGESGLIHVSGHGSQEVGFGQEPKPQKRAERYVKQCCRAPVPGPRANAPQPDPDQVNRPD